MGAEAVAGWQGYSAALGEALARDDRDRALELFMELAGSPQEMVAQVKASEHWPSMRELAPTLAYDAACLGDGPPPAERLSTILQPTLVITGPGGEEAMQELAVDFMGNSADAVVAAMPAAERRRLTQGSHMVDPVALGPVLANWFDSRPHRRTASAAAQAPRLQTPPGAERDRDGDARAARRRRHGS